MDVKSTFLDVNLKEEVYIEHPKGFQLSEYKDYVCILKKALYGVKKAPKSWYLNGCWGFFPIPLSHQSPNVPSSLSPLLDSFLTS